MNMDRQTTVSVIENLLKHGRFNTVTRNAMENAVRLLKEQEAVVRCKYCKHGRICNNLILGKIVDCPKGTPHIHNLDWFCADGERMD